MCALAPGSWPVAAEHQASHHWRRTNGIELGGGRTVLDPIMGIVDAQEPARPEPCHQLADGLIEPLERILRREVLGLHLGDLVPLALEDRQGKQQVK